MIACMGIMSEKYENQLTTSSVVQRWRCAAKRSSELERDPWEGSAFSVGGAVMHGTRVHMRSTDGIARRDRPQANIHAANIHAGLCSRFPPHKNCQFCWRRSWQ